MKRISHITPAKLESKPATTVNDRVLMNFSDQPAAAVDRLQINISAARSVVDTLPRKLSGTKRISKAS